MRFLKPVELPKRCMLNEVLLWLAFLQRRNSPCAERRAYLTFDIFRGRLSYRFHPEARPVRTGDLMGEMRRAIAAEETERRKHDRFASTLVIAASVIAAVRLAREDISRPSPRVASVVADSIALARTILDRIVR